MTLLLVTFLSTVLLPPLLCYFFLKTPVRPTKSRAITTPEIPFQKALENKEISNSLSYPEATLHQFTKQESDDAYLRLINNVRDEAGNSPLIRYAAGDGDYFYAPDHSTTGSDSRVKHKKQPSPSYKASKKYQLPSSYDVETENLYVWGQSEPIAIFEHRYTLDKYFVVWGFDNTVGVGKDTRYPISEEVNSWGVLSKEQWETAFEAVKLGIIEGVQDCFDAYTYFDYITVVYDQNKTLKNSVTKDRGRAIIDRQRKYREEQSNLKYYVGWDKTFHEAYFMAESGGHITTSNEYVTITERDYNAAYRAAVWDDLPWRINCFNRPAFNNYIRKVVGAKYSFTSLCSRPLNCKEDL